MRVLATSPSWPATSASSGSSVTPTSRPLPRSSSPPTTISATSMPLSSPRLNPRIRIVIRLFDADLTRQAAGAVPQRRRAFVVRRCGAGVRSAAIDGDGGGRFDIGGRVLTALQVPTNGDGLPPHVEGVDRVVLARLHPNRTVDILPEAAVDEPGLLLVEVAEPRLATDLDELAAPSSGGRPRRSVADQAQAVPGAVRDRLASPERRLVRFGAVLGLLAVAPRCTSG